MMLGTRSGDHAVFSEELLVWILPTAVSIVTFAVHCYYAYCIRLISQSRKIAIAIVLLTFIQLAGGISTSILAIVKVPKTSATYQRASKAVNIGVRP